MSVGRDGWSERPEYEDPSHIDLVIGPGRAADNQSFGQILAKARKIAGLSRAAAGASLDVSAEYLRLIELGRRTPAMGQMQAVMELYNIEGEVGPLQPGGDRPDLIFFPPNADEPVMVDFVSRIREARRRSNTLHGSNLAQEASEPHADTNKSDGNRTSMLGRIVLLLSTADDEVLADVWDLLLRTTDGQRPDGASI